MDKKKHARFTAGSAKIIRKVGGTFTINDSTGTNIELVQGTKIVQTWGRYLAGRSIFHSNPHPLPGFIKNETVLCSDWCSWGPVWGDQLGLVWLLPESVKKSIFRSSVKVRNFKNFFLHLTDVSFSNSDRIAPDFYGDCSWPWFLSKKNYLVMISLFVYVFRGIMEDPGAFLQ